MTDSSESSQNPSPSYRQHRQAARAIAANCAILTLSDTRDESTDLSGQLIRKLLEEAGHAVGAYRVIPDEPEKLREIAGAWLGDEKNDAIITNGGTGISRRDQTVEGIAQMIETPLPGFGELFRMLSWRQIGSGAMLSRAIGGIARGKVIFALPGSRAAVELAMRELILPELPHIIHELRKTP